MKAKIPRFYRRENFRWYLSFCDNAILRFVLIVQIVLLSPTLQSAVRRCALRRLQGWPTSQRLRATYFTVLLQRATSHMGTHEHNLVSSSSSSLTHIPLFIQICCKYHTPIWQWQNFTSHLLLCIVYSRTSGNYIRAAWNRANNRGLAIPTGNYIRAAWNLA